MARLTISLSARLVLIVLAAHAVLLPALFVGIFTGVEKSQKDLFVDHTRIYGRILADVFETSSALDSEASTIAVLDNAVLSGTGLYAAIQFGDRMITSSLIDADDVSRFNEDFEFGDHGDNVYYLSIPLQVEGRQPVLQLGFDEGPTLNEINQARERVINILLIYLFIALILGVVTSVMLVRPLQQLRRASRQIASGQYGLELAVDTRLTEIIELTNDLETMRKNLVGVNKQLAKEISDREAAEEQQLNLEARLRHAQRLESVGTLAGGIAHEFNNVLQPILLYTDLALEDLPEDSPVREKLQRVLSLASRAKGLSQQILTFSRQAGLSERKVLDIVPIVEEALTMVRALVPATIDIQVNIDESSGKVLCDATQLQQLVVNLCSNAFKSMSKGGGCICVELENCIVDEDFCHKHPKLKVGSYIRLSVSDTGQGMDEKTMERIFEPFFTTQDIGGGTGLGLSVVHGIVASHEGDIVVESQIGQGSIFYIYLPQANSRSSSAAEKGAE